MPLRLMPYGCRTCWVRVFGGLLLAFAVPVIPSLGQEDPPPADRSIRIGLIGLDTSHSVAFTKLLNDANAEGPRQRCEVTTAYPFGSRDIESSVSRIPRYTEEMKALDVEIVDSIEMLVDQVDAVLLETNDGRPHLEQALIVLKAGKPLFVDKPMAGSLEDVIAIFLAAQHYGAPVFSSSALRYATPALAARRGEAVGGVTGAATFSPATREPTHPDLYWYGIHGVEQLFTVMGTGCESVTRVETDSTDIVVGVWQDGRVGTFRGLRSGPHHYGGTVFGENGESDSGGYEGYAPLVEVIAQFFVDREVPVDPDETIEIYTFLTAADVSKDRHGASVSLKEVLHEAQNRAEQKLQVLGVLPKTDF